MAFDATYGRLQKLQFFSFSKYCPSYLFPFPWENFTGTINHDIPSITSPSYRSGQMNKPGQSQHGMPLEPRRSPLWTILIIDIRKKDCPYPTSQNSITLCAMGFQEPSFLLHRKKASTNKRELHQYAKWNRNKKIKITLSPLI